MALQALHESSGRWSPVAPGVGRYRVILDHGSSVTLVLVDAATGLRVGDRLDLNGSSWRIWSYRRHAKAFVAHPADC